MLTTTTSPPCFSLRRRLSSTAISSKGFTTHLTPSFTYPEPSAATRSLISGSGTRFAVHRIFTFSDLSARELEARLITRGGPHCQADRGRQKAERLRVRCRSFVQHSTVCSINANESIYSTP